MDTMPGERQHILELEHEIRGLTDENERLRKALEKARTQALWAGKTSCMEIVQIVDVALKGGERGGEATYPRKPEDSLLPDSPTRKALDL